MNETYKDCIKVASWFIQSQCTYMPIILVPQKAYSNDLNGITHIADVCCPTFEVRPYDGPTIIPIPTDSVLP